MRSFAKIPASMLMCIATTYPLIDLIKSFGDIEHSVSLLSIGLIITFLVLGMILSLLWLYFSWNEFLEDFN